MPVGLCHQTRVQVSADCHDKIPRWGGCMNINLFSHSSQGWKSLTKVPAWLSSGEHSLPGLQNTTFSLRGRKGQREKGTNLIMTSLMTSYKPNYLWNTITLRVRALVYEFSPEQLPMVQKEAFHKPGARSEGLWNRDRADSWWASVSLLVRGEAPRSLRATCHHSMPWPILSKMPPYSVTWWTWSMDEYNSHPLSGQIWKREEKKWYWTYCFFSQIY